MVERVCRYGAKCRHFEAGNCYYSHVLDGGPGGFCWHFANGRCKFGEQCGKRHWEEPKDLAMAGRQCVVCAPAREEVTAQAPAVAAEPAPTVAPTVALGGQAGGEAKAQGTEGGVVRPTETV